MLFATHENMTTHGWPLNRLADNTIVHNAVIHFWRVPPQTPFCVKYCTITKDVNPVTLEMSSMVSVAPKTCCTYHQRQTWVGWSRK